MHPPIREVRWGSGLGRESLPDMPGRRLMMVDANAFLDASLSRHRLTTVTPSGEWLGSSAEEERAKLRNATGSCKET
jgi:hypothetical protein